MDINGRDSLERADADMHLQTSYGQVPFSVSLLPDKDTDEYPDEEFKDIIEDFGDEGQPDNFLIMDDGAVFSDIYDLSKITKQYFADSEDDGFETAFVVLGDAPGDDKTERRKERITKAGRAVKLFFRKLRRIPWQAYTALAAAIIIAAGIYYIRTFRKTYTVFLRGEENRIVAYAKNARIMLLRSGLEYDPMSRIDIDEDEKGGTVVITEPYPVTVRCDGGTVSLRTTGDTVENFIRSAGIEIYPDDITEPGRDEYIGESTDIVLKRIKHAVYEDRFIIEKEVSDLSNESDFTVTSPGRNGIGKHIYMQTYTDGVKTEEELIDSVVIRDAVPEKIFSYGYSGLLPTMEDAPKEYREVIEIECTSYYLPGQTTATGKKAQYGYVAVDPKFIPLHTRMFICSPDGKIVYGYCQAEDTGSAVKGNIVDLHLNSEEECWQFGRRKMIAYILD